VASRAGGDQGAASERSFRQPCARGAVATWNCRLGRAGRAAAFGRRRALLGVHSLYGDCKARAAAPACMEPQPYWKYTLERLNVLALLQTMRFDASRVISAPNR